MLYEKDDDPNYLPGNGFNSLWYRPLSALQGDGNSYFWMQFTGLLDKNGKEIYEGDIVSFPEVTTGKTIGEVWWQLAAGYWAIDWSHGEVMRNGDWRPKMENALQLEVIGNIYENPELLQ